MSYATLNYSTRTEEGTVKFSKIYTENKDQYRVVYLDILSDWINILTAEYEQLLKTEHKGE